MVTTASGFDSDKWKALRGTSEKDNPRARMLRTVEQQLHAGMTQTEVLALLGEPEAKEGRRFVYDLGMSTFGVDYEYFVIEFDADGKLSRHQITRG
jgi:hypothetical protein